MDCMTSGPTPSTLLVPIVRRSLSCLKRCGNAWFDTRLHVRLVTNHDFYKSGAHSRPSASRSGPAQRHCPSRRSGRSQAVRATVTGRGGPGPGFSQWYAGRVQRGPYNPAQTAAQAASGLGAAGFGPGPVSARARRLGSRPDAGLLEPTGITVPHGLARHGGGAATQAGIAAAAGARRGPAAGVTVPGPGSEAQADRASLSDPPAN